MKKFKQRLILSKTNDVLKNSFNPSEIEKEINDALDKTKTRPGKLGLQNTLKEVPDTQGAMVYLAAVDVADAEGSIGDDEKKTLTKIAGLLHVNENELDV